MDSNEANQERRFIENLQKMTTFTPLAIEQLEPTLQASFPYLRWCAIHDARTIPEHMALETSGIQGTEIYRRDDPLFADWWALRRRWERRGRAPCRCGWIDMSVKDAAVQFKISEAIEWHRTKEPPANPQWIGRLDFNPWDKKLVERCRRS